MNSVRKLDLIENEKAKTAAIKLIKKDFTKYLKENCWKCSDKCNRNSKSSHPPPPPSPPTSENIHTMEHLRSESIIS